MGYGNGTESNDRVTSIELARLGTIHEDQYKQTHVRVVKLSWKNREGAMIVEDLPRVDVREWKKTASFTGWSKGLSMKLEDYRKLKALIPAIDAALAEHGFEAA